MDGNGRWAEQRGLKRTEGHKRGEAVLLDMVAACQALDIPYLSAYAFSTENWRRSADEVRFLMGFNRDVLTRQKMWLHERGVKVRWVGRRPRLWRSVLRELESAEELTKNNTNMTLFMCVNYGGRAEIIDGVREIVRKAQRGEIRPEEFPHLPGRAHHAGCGPLPAALGGETHLQLPPVAVGLCRDGVSE